MTDAIKLALDKCEKAAIESGAHESYQIVRESFAELRTALAALRAQPDHSEHAWCNIHGKFDPYTNCQQCAGKSQLAQLEQARKELREAIANREPVPAIEGKAMAFHGLQMRDNIDAQVIEQLKPFDDPENDAEAWMMLNGG